MNLLSIIILAIGLAMDSFAVSVSQGLLMTRFRIRRAFLIALLFGFFQALLPVIGWLLGLRVADFIQDFDHWIAFALLIVIGSKMIWESSALCNKKTEKFHSASFATLLVFAVATSIDAFAIGLSFSIIGITIITPVIIIGIITFIFSYSGVFIGSKVGHIAESKIEALGGIIIIAVGIKILIEGLLS